MKKMKLEANRSSIETNWFFCTRCHQRSFNIIFHEIDTKNWYCTTCLIKELNKPDEV